MDKNKEIILAVPDRIVQELGVPKGVSILPAEEIAAILSGLSCYVIADERGKFEGNPTFRQFIPYVSVQCGDLFFNAIRTKEGGDQRLHGKKIIGFGGHANPIDTEFTQTLSAKLRANAVRELDEELIMPDGYSLTFKGFINDSSIPVNMDHLGIYMTATVGTTDVAVNETSVLVNPVFSSIDDLKDREAYAPAMGVVCPLESWSAMILEGLYQVQQGM
jgi:predicted NUDIX family phosphoesterase